MDKNILIDAICGKGFNTIQFGHYMEEKGFARYCGDQYNPDWSWNRTKLYELTINELENLYSIDQKTFIA